MVVMLRLSDHAWVATSEVAQILLGITHATLVLKNGTQHRISPDADTDLSTTVERLILKIEHAARAAVPMDVRVNPEGHAVAETARWYYPVAGEGAPHGVDVMLLTKGGIQITGKWNASGDFIAWAPKLKRNKTLEVQYLGITAAPQDKPGEAIENL